MSTGLIPGPHVKEHDDSFVSGSPGVLQAANFITASWGPVGEKVKTVSPSGLVANFGKPSTTSMFASMAMAKAPLQLVNVRVTDGSEDKAEVTVLSGVTDIFKATAKYPGTTGDEIQVRVMSPSDGNVAKINLVVYIYGVIADRFVNVDSFATLEALSSGYVDFEEAVGTPTWPADWSGEYDTMYDLSGGSDGIAAPDMSSYYIGTETTGPVPATGLNLFNDIANDEVDLILTPGISNPNVVAAGLVLAVKRDDAVFPVDGPDNMSFEDIRDWHNGSFGGGPTLPLNNSFGTLCYPWMSYYDEYSASTVEIPPSAGFAIAVANTWRDSGHPYASPANYISTKMPEYITGLRYNPTPDMIIQTYDTAGQNINWFKNWVGYGITLWGQKTLQREKSALDRLNVRFTLNALKRRLMRDTRRFTFKMNEPGQQALLSAFVSSILDTMVGVGIAQYRIKCDEEVNTPQVKSENKMICTIYVKPLTASEWLFFDIFVTGQGATL